MSRPNLPYLFYKLTLYFLAFSVMVHAAGARRGRGIYHLIEDHKGYRAVYGTCGAPRGGRFLGCVGGVRLRESYPIFQGVTLDFLTFSTTARPTGARHGREIYHPVEKKKSYRLICDTGMCGDRGGRGGDMRS